MAVAKGGGSGAGMGGGRTRYGGGSSAQRMSGGSGNVRVVKGKANSPKPGSGVMKKPVITSARKEKRLLNEINKPPKSRAGKIDKAYKSMGSPKLDRFDFRNDKNWRERQMDISYKNPSNSRMSKQIRNAGKRVPKRTV